MPNLNTGRLFSTNNITSFLVNEEFKCFVEDCYKRHQSKDWGDLEEEDKECNNFALENNSRILSSYNISENLEKLNLPNNRIWIITEYDRNCTTILFPSDY